MQEEIDILNKILSDRKAEVEAFYTDRFRDEIQGRTIHENAPVGHSWAIGGAAHALGVARYLVARGWKAEWADAAAAEFLQRQSSKLISAGYEKQRIIVDPGIGFGKKLKHNRQLTQSLRSFSDIGGAVLYGPSRKTFLGELCNIKNPHERDWATLGAACYAAQNGAHIVRVHNVKATHDALKVSQWLWDTQESL